MIVNKNNTNYCIKLFLLQCERLSTICLGVDPFIYEETANITIEMSGKTHKKSNKIKLDPVGKNDFSIRPVSIFINLRSQFE